MGRQKSNYIDEADFIKITQKLADLEKILYWLNNLAKLSPKTVTDDFKRITKDIEQKKQNLKKKYQEKINEQLQIAEAIEAAEQFK